MRLVDATACLASKWSCTSNTPSCAARIRVRLRVEEGENHDEYSRKLQLSLLVCMLPFLLKLGLLSTQRVRGLSTGARFSSEA